MPKFLIVSATRFEAQPLLAHFGVQATEDTGIFTSAEKRIDLHVLLTGVGMVNTAYALGRHSHSLFDYVINMGVCGAFNRVLQIGEVVQVMEDRISELGAEDGHEFIAFENMGLGGTSVYRPHWNADHELTKHIKAVKAITVNTVHGHEPTIARTAGRFAPDVESMEGAAFYRSCNRLAAQYIQLRAVSNYVERRDKSKWNMPLAIANLNHLMINLISTLNT